MSRVAAPEALRNRVGRGGRLRAGWTLGDRLGVAGAWLAGLALCAIALAIVVYMLVRGLQFLNFDLLISHPRAELDQSKSGGFLDPLLGTLILTVLAILLALPLGVGIAVWLAEFGRPAWLARAVEAGVEVVAGTPSVVLAIFGLVLFQQHIFAFMSFKAEGGAVFARSFLTAGAMMALIALPLVVGATREALRSIPDHVREASYSLGKSKAATIRRVLLPGARSGIATGAALGMGRVAGDTAIVVILLGASLQLSPQGDLPILRTLRGTGSTLTSYVYNNSPAGEGNAPQKAYAAAFVLLLIVLCLNFAVDVIQKKGGPRWES
ncbi:phosphate ABC transporter permease PstA [Thermoleophilum album]|uniref:Phosphate transport system permease protein PstA n=1 Tax=Thermoleophilum album TaxID=29539 RepID=A0A1H6FJ05_THEAL|nr:phosphate ABC transporter permease PstA [Thermoleophilum album]SEH10180.1 phosphate transport system permease protein [Thermoleophilum album]